MRMKGARVVPKIENQAFVDLKGDPATARNCAEF
jgi:hypothetical protein